MGRLVTELARDRIVIAVTHRPELRAMADQHIRLEPDLVEVSS